MIEKGEQPCKASAAHVRQFRAIDAMEIEKVLCLPEGSWVTRLKVMDQ
jgi:hypothetical protein